MANFSVEVTKREVDTLVQVAHFYERSMGPMRLVVRMTASAEIRQKYRFIAEESLWLEKMARAQREQIAASRCSSATLTLTPRALVAFWGRLLTSTRNRRARKKLKGDELAVRETLSSKLLSVARQAQATVPQLLNQELATRRPAEAAWMREELSPSAPQIEEAFPPA